MALTSAQLREQLEKAVEAAGTQTAWAKRHGISVAYVNDLLRERKEFSDAVARKLGYRRVLMYEERRKNGRK
jgi:hypothetical protein